MIEERVLKAYCATNLLKQAVSLQGNNFNTKLAINLFDKMISPILLYGCSIWGLPNKTNMLYVKNIPEVKDTRSALSQLLNKLSKPHIVIKSAKRIGKKNTSPRPVLLELSNIDDKFEIKIWLIITITI